MRSVGDVAKEMDSPSILVEIGHGHELIFYEIRAADRFPILFKHCHQFMEDSKFTSLAEAACPVPKRIHEDQESKRNLGILSSKGPALLRPSLWRRAGARSLRQSKQLPTADILSAQWL